MVISVPGANKWVKTNQWNLLTKVIIMHIIICVFLCWNRKEIQISEQQLRDHWPPNNTTDALISGLVCRSTQEERIIYSKEGWFIINYSTKNVKRKKEYKLNSKCYRWHVAEHILTVRSRTTHALMKLLLCHLKRTHQAAPAYLSHYYILWDSEIDWTHYTCLRVNISILMDIFTGM